MDHVARACAEEPEIMDHCGTCDPLAPAQVVGGPMVGSDPLAPMFKRVSARARRGDGGRSRVGLVH